MTAISKPTLSNEANEADLFLGTEGIEPNQSHSLSQEQGELLVKGIATQGSEPTAALKKAFAQRKRNLERQRGTL